MAVEGEGIPLGGVTDSANRHDSPLLAPTLEHAAELVGGLSKEASVHLDRGYQALTAWG
jgi:IS5 family transposase